MARRSEIVTLKREAAEAVPPASATKSQSPRSLYHAMWAWNTKPIIEPDGRGELDRLLAFCFEKRIQEIYLAVEFDNGSKGDRAPARIRAPEGYRAFLARAHQQGLKVEALAGTPEWAVKEHHADALAAVDAVLAFNRARDPASSITSIALSGRKRSEI